MGTNFYPLMALDRDELDEGTINVSDMFRAMDSLQQADLLQDWIDGLTEMKENVTGPGFLEDLAPARYRKVN